MEINLKMLTQNDDVLKKSIYIWEMIDKIT